MAEALRRLSEAGAAGASAWGALACTVTTAPWPHGVASLGRVRHSVASAPGGKSSSAAPAASSVRARPGHGCGPPACSTSQG